MNTKTASPIHSAELLLCGCRVDPNSGSVFSHCARHACYSVARFKEVELPKDPSGQGLRPLCAHCASYRIRPETDHIVCDDCGAEFQPSDVVGFALSVDSKPHVCPVCNATVYGICHCYEHNN